MTEMLLPGHRMNVYWALKGTVYSYLIMVEQKRLQLDKKYIEGYCG